VSSLFYRIFQAWLYILAFSMAWIFPMIQWVISQVGGQLYFPILSITVIINPLQGFFNAVIYIRPRFLEHYRRKRREKLQEDQEGSAEGESSSGDLGRRATAWQAVVHACSITDEPADEEDEDPACEESEKL
jgi:hypothetical protein